MTKKKPLTRDPEYSQEMSVWLDELNTVAAHKMVSWLKAGTDTNRPINTLTLTHMKALATVAWTHYEGELPKRPKLKPLSDDDQLSLWMGG